MKEPSREPQTSRPSFTVLISACSVVLKGMESEVKKCSTSSRDLRKTFSILSLLIIISMDWLIFVSMNMVDPCFECI